MKSDKRTLIEGKILNLMINIPVVTIDILVTSNSQS